MHTIYFESLGCNKNTVDSEIMLSLLRKQGYERTGSPENASVIVVNTCAFIDDAKREAIDVIMSLARSKREGARLVVAGCLPQLYHREILEGMPEVDAVVGIGNLEAILEAVEPAGTGRDFPSSRVAGGKYREYAEGRELLTPPGYAYLKISDGCSRGCSFCLIPSIRGGLRSRTPESILEDAKSLEAKGAREIILVSQDTLGYGRDLGIRPGLPLLVERLLRGTERCVFRLLYLRPGGELGNVLSLFEDKRVLRYFDVPLQHVSGKILKAMRRRGGYDGYLEMVNGIRERYEDAVLRTTFIVGFPGEDEDDFELLERFAREARFDHLGVFRFSPQEGTAAFDLAGRVPGAVSERRRERLLRLQRDVSRSHLEREIGKVLDVLVEERVAGEDLYIGRSYHFAPEVDGVFVLRSGKELEPGDLVRAKVTRADDYDLHGEIEEGKA